jgi:DNA-binding transcriptional LysR family regulator
MTATDRARGALVQILLAHTVEVRQPIHAVYYRNTALASRIACFLDYLAGQLVEA